MDKRVNVNQIEVCYRTTGSGADVVLLHGWGCDHTIWEGVQRHLEGRFRVTAIDLPGFGKSSEPPLPWGVEQYALNLQLLLEKLGIVNPILMGHSHGGRVCLLYCSRNAVRKMILVDSAGIKPPRGLTYYAKVYSFKALRVIAPLLIGKKRAGVLIDKRRNSSGSSDYKLASAVMRSTLSRVVNEDLKHVMPKIEAPTLLIWGANDTATPLSDGVMMEKLIRGSGLVVFDGAAHYSFLERPSQFAAVIDSFLSEDSREVEIGL